jgi:hypothetical protein
MPLKHKLRNFYHSADFAPWNSAGSSGIVHQRSNRQVGSASGIAMTIKLMMMAALYCLFVVGPIAFAAAREGGVDRALTILPAVKRRWRAAASPRGAARLPLLGRVFRRRPQGQEPAG